MSDHKNSNTFADLNNRYSILRDGFWYNNEKTKPFNETPLGKKKDYDMKWMAHSFWSLIPFKDYAGTHPEFFALVKGERPDANQGSGFYHRKQLCTTSPALISEAAGRIGHFLKNNPGYDSIILGPNDGYGFCECSRCRELDNSKCSFTVEDINNFSVACDTPGYSALLSARLLTFYKNVAEIVKEKFPDHIIRCPVYSIYRDGPDEWSGKLPENLELMSARSYCHAHRLDDVSCKHNQEYLSGLKKYIKLGVKVSVYEYYWKQAWLELPFPVLRNIAPDREVYRQYGICGFKSQIGDNCGTLGPVYETLLQVYTKGENDWEKVLTEYCSRYFAPAAEYAIKYYLLLEEHASFFKEHYVLPGNYLNTISSFFSSGLLTELRELAEKIQQKTESTIFSLNGKMLYTSFLWSDKILAYLAAARNCSNINEAELKIQEIKMCLRDKSFKHIIEETEYIKEVLKYEKCSRLFSGRSEI
ncbi:MAG: hypothetical protein A2096_08345 [Spirochaetes bacterium GWF1_41_5]|nr:MAG: hypothetical protein A2096_08345 [Spirochaetes bacterium GWF1_41_5]HBE03702.1 hypothetical protein [Spirochaetia bacterium]